MNDPQTTPMFPQPGNPSWYPVGAPDDQPYPGGPERKRQVTPEHERTPDPYATPPPYQPGSEYQTRPGPPTGNGAKLNAGRLWAGGAATAIVSALIAVVGVSIGSGIFAVPIPVPAIGGLSAGAYVGLAAAAALVATALVHALIMVAPKPLAFFGWIVFLATVAAVIAPFANSMFGSFSHVTMLNSKVSTAVINLVLGIAIGTLLAGVARSSVTFRGPRPPVPPQGYPTGMR